MAGYIEPKREQERRRWLEDGERLKDLEEDFSEAKRSGTLTQALKQELSATRGAYRLQGEQTGKRAGMVAVTTIWWRRWLEIGTSHEVDSRRAFNRLVGGDHNSDGLLDEFENAVVAICSAAFAIEALYNDFVYRIPPGQWKRAPTQIQRIRYGLKTGWTLEERYASALVKRIDGLLRMRGDVVHAYPDTLPARPHPAGLNSGAEHEVFNAVTTRAAIDLAIEVVELTLMEPSADLPAPHNRWLRRWVDARQPYRDQIREMQNRRDQEPLDESSNNN